VPAAGSFRFARPCPFAYVAVQLYAKRTGLAAELQALRRNRQRRKSPGSGASTNRNTGYAEGMKPTVFLIAQVALVSGFYGCENGEPEARNAAAGTRQNLSRPIFALLP